MFRGLPAGVWTVLTWCATTAYSMLVSVRLPGETDTFPRYGFDRPAGSWINLAAAGVLTLAGSGLLRRLPLPAMFLVLAGAVFGAMAINSTEIGFVQFLPVDVALCFVAARHRQGRQALAMALGVLVLYAVTRVLLRFPIGTGVQLAVALSAVTAWLIGHSIRQSRDNVERLAAQAVTTERLRISRELHDMVAHSIGIIALQAGAARRVIDTQPAAARDAMTAVETASRETLAGLRRMLGALRVAEAAPLDPPPSLADLDRLAAATTAAGVRVDVRWLGERRPLPAEIDLSAFRIVQEAVTNVVRHAGTRSCRVTLTQGEDEMSIEVEDDGSGPHQSGNTNGYGIAGMRERVGLLHGDFSAGGRPEGGFRVWARLPVPAAVR